jgi:hypothetical protein
VRVEARRAAPARRVARADRQRADRQQAAPTPARLDRLMALRAQAERHTERRVAARKAARAPARVERHTERRAPVRARARRHKAASMPQPA